MNHTKTIRLQREATDRPWGFRLQGGSDYPVPLSIQLVNPNTPAYENGLNAGDKVILINGQNVTHMTHEEVKMVIIRSGDELELTVIEGKPNQQSIPRLSQSTTGIKTEPINQKPTYWQSDNHSQEIPEHLRPKVTNFESSSAYNRNPLQREIWRPKAYHDKPQTSSDNVGTAVYHAQYNSPIGLYSDDKVLEAFKTQAGSLINEIKGFDLSNSFENNNNNNNNNIHIQQSPTYQAVMNNDQSKNLPYSSEGKLSRSFRLLEQDLLSVEGTSQLPKSIFDQRRQQN